eukprot:gene19861-25812_t
MADDDEEYDYDYGSDAEYDYGSDADENEVTNDEAIEIENMFYEGEDLKNENRVKAAELFEKVIELESQKGDEIKWRFKALHELTLNLNSAVSDPRIMGIIREEGGKMYMTESNWDDAYNELYEAFRNYQEAGNSRAKSCLKYVVLASMLALSDINPFAAREAKVYADDKEILAMSELRQSLEANDLDRFENILNKKSNRIIDEPFLMTYIQPLRRRMREQVLINLTKPYQKVTLKYLGKELNLNENEVELLLVDLILDERLSASIDQTNGYVILTKNNLLLNSNENKLLRVINNWTEALNEITESYVNRLI